MPRFPAQTATAAALSCLACAAHATNGMNLEGYGPLAMSMGGASMAYDSGMAAMMNNPATLALTVPGQQLALALHHLGPDVAVQGVAGSGGDSYFMPAIGWGRKDGRLTYGVGMFAQGGMGTEYGRDTMFSMGTGQEVRSELGVGRLILPLAYEVTPDLALGGSLDYVWAMLDVGMVATRDQVLGMTGGAAEIGPGNNAYIGFSDDNDFTGKAKGTGWAGKLGLTYKFSPVLTVGASYHSKTRLSDMKTSAEGAEMAVYDGSGALVPGSASTGKLAVIDFQWPETWAVGLAWQATPKLMLAADVRRLNWSDAMQNFRMAYNGMTMTMPQQWDDQTVYAIGLQYRPTDRLGLRAGLNYGKNPVPDAWLHPLFPATVERHYTAGFDYRLSDAGCIAGAVSFAPEVSDVNGMGMAVTHGQVSAMIGYNHHF
ncbi:MAG: outer membrane protein transport protein [Gallionellaceae bacterium]|nr:outer membrane protein transport protein [Gallionellaceae bacterium]